MQNGTNPNGTMQEGRLAFAWRRWKLQRRFRRKMGYHGNFEHPNTLDEKIHFRKLYGNHEFNALLADKYRVREYVRDRVGEQYLVPLYGVYDELTADVFDDLPEKFVIKTNHGCKWQKIVTDKGALDVPETLRYFRRLMRDNYARKAGEYHYRLIQPKILIEQFLDDDGDSPCDYNIFCYHRPEGFRRTLTISTPRVERVAHFGLDDQLMESNLRPEEEAKYFNPPNLEEMFQVAEALSRGIDFVRIDLYSLRGQIYFGEATLTPASGLTPIKDPVRSKMRSELWHLDADNPALYRRRNAA